MSFTEQLSRWVHRVLGPELRRNINRLIDRGLRRRLPNIVRGPVLGARGASSSAAIIMPVAPPISGLVYYPLSDSAQYGWGEPYENPPGNPINPPLGSNLSSSDLCVVSEGGFRYATNASGSWQVTHGTQLVGGLRWKKSGDRILTCYPTYGWWEVALPGVAISPIMYQGVPFLSYEESGGIYYWTVTVAVIHNDGVDDWVYVVLALRNSASDQIKVARHKVDFAESPPVPLGSWQLSNAETLTDWDTTDINHALDLLGIDINASVTEVVVNGPFREALLDLAWPNLSLRENNTFGEDADIPVNRSEVGDTDFTPMPNDLITFWCETKQSEWSTFDKSMDAKVLGVIQSRYLDNTNTLVRLKAEVGVDYVLDVDTDYNYTLQQIGNISCVNGYSSVDTYVEDRVTLLKYLRQVTGQEEEELFSIELYREETRNWYNFSWSFNPDPFNEGYFAYPCPADFEVETGFTTSESGSNTIDEIKRGCEGYVLVDARIGLFAPRHFKYYERHYAATDPSSSTRWWPSPGDCCQVNTGLTQTSDVTDSDYTVTTSIRRGIENLYQFVTDHANGGDSMVSTPTEPWQHPPQQEDDFVIRTMLKELYAKAVYFGWKMPNFGTSRHEIQGLPGKHVVANIYDTPTTPRAHVYFTGGDLKTLTQMQGSEQVVTARTRFPGIGAI